MQFVNDRAVKLRQSLTARSTAKSRRLAIARRQSTRPAIGRYTHAMADELLWPDDRRLETTRHGILASTHDGKGYFVSNSLLAERPNVLSEHRTAITAYVLQNAGSDPAELSTYNIDTIVNRRRPTVKEKLDALRRELARATNFQVGSVRLSSGLDDPLTNSILRRAALEGPPEMISLLKYLAASGHVLWQPTSSNLNVDTTVPGLVFVQEQEHPALESRNCFVAMWFGPEMISAYDDGIAPAIEANGYNPVRIDRADYNNKIDDEILSQIRRARFVVADFSCGADGARGGVYFEAGFALALDRQVIFSVRRSDLERLHFDTRQFNHIMWEAPADLEMQLRNRIGATIGPFSTEG